jgi:hypothetical protein
LWFNASSSIGCKMDCRAKSHNDRGPLVVV